MSDALALQLIIAVTQYCSTVGMRVEYNNTLKVNGNDINCFEKIWSCGHATTHASAISLNTHNCISKHLKKEL